MRNTVEIKVPREDMAVHGKGYEINTLRSIRSVSYVLNVDLQFRWKRFTTSFRWVKVAHMIGVIWLCCASRVIHRFMRSVVTDGNKGSREACFVGRGRGRGYQNLYRPISYRTAGGCCVCSREMEYGGIKHYTMHEMCRNVLQCILQCSLKMLYVSL